MESKSAQDYKPLPYRTTQKAATGLPLTRPERLGPPDIEPGEIVYDEVKDFIGEGVFGKVFKGRCRQTSVAVKVPKTQNLTTQQVQSFKKEVTIMSQIFHPNIVLFMGACTRPGNIKILTELMESDLEHFLRTVKAKQTSLLTRINMAKDAAKGLSWLHGINNIIHRDLKPANILIDGNYNVKITDFGFSEILRGEKTMRDSAGPRGTALWMSPEVMNSEEFDKSADVYSFSIILWQLYTLEEPFAEFDDWDEFYEAICIDSLRPEIPNDCPNSLRHLMQNCWDPDRKKRPTFPEVVYRLDEVLVDIAIPNEEAAKFWKKYFVVPKQELEESVRWKEFSSALTDSTGIKDKSKFDILQQYSVTPPDNEKVSMTSFDTCATWFGNFFSESNAEQTLKEITKLIKEPWFHGLIDQKEADGRLAAALQKGIKGAYLIRLSKTQRDCPYTLSLTEQRHFRIKKSISENGVLLSVGNLDKICSNLYELIEGVTPHLSLSHPCPKVAARNAYIEKV